MIHQEQYQISSDIIHYDVMDLYIIEPGIVVSEYKAEFELDIDFAIEVNKQVGILTNGKALPQLFMACPGLSVSKEVREWGVTELANEYTLSSAIVCNLLSHRILGNFLIKVQRPPVPTKMFNNVDDAIVWLKASIQ
jgi:hypothetical protein